MLSDRRQLVLRALIEEYIARAIPVGSRTITEHYKLGVSPATVRNDLSALEEEGYISQPHTSAGRIPTDIGYRAFVDDLLASDILKDQHPYEKIVNQLRTSAAALDELIEKTSNELTRLTDCLSIITMPSVLMTNIRQISLISLTNYRALIVIVTNDGQVVNRQVGFSEEVSPEDIFEVQEILSKFFVGKTMKDVRESAYSEIVETLKNPRMRLILDEVVKCIKENDIGRMQRVGVSSLMRKPEFHDSTSLLPLMEILENDTVLFDVLDDEKSSSDNIIVKIGQENAAAELSGVSVIAGIYGRGESQGVVAVIGPTRMDYSCVIRAVRAAQNVLHEE